MRQYPNQGDVPASETSISIPPHDVASLFTQANPKYIGRLKMNVDKVKDWCRQEAVKQGWTRVEFNDDGITGLHCVLLMTAIEPKKDTTKVGSGNSAGSNQRVLPPFHRGF